MREREQHISTPNWEVLQQIMNYIECPQNPEHKKPVVNLKEGGKEMFVYCNACGTIIYDSKKEKEDRHPNGY